jgi:hypothetical protein
MTSSVAKESTATAYATSIALNPNIHTHRSVTGTELDLADQNSYDDIDVNQN